MKSDIKFKLRKPSKCRFCGGTMMTRVQSENSFICNICGGKI